MSDDDLIRRGDAVDAVNGRAYGDAVDALRALPASEEVARLRAELAEARKLPADAEGRIATVIRNTSGSLYTSGGRAETDAEEDTRRARAILAALAEPATGRGRGFSEILVDEMTPYKRPKPAQAPSASEKQGTISDKTEPDPAYPTDRPYATMRELRRAWYARDAVKAEIGSNTTRAYRCALARGEAIPVVPCTVEPAKPAPCGTCGGAGDVPRDPRSLAIGKPKHCPKCGGGK